jgi:hypothetical protein
MTSQEFVLWLKGFTEGVHEFNITPKQWDLLKEKLEEVEDKTLILESPKFPFGTPNTYPTPLDPYNPFKVYCDSSSGSFGTTTPPYTLTTTPGYGHITTYNPVQFGTGSFSTTTATSLPFGSNVTYTNGGNDIKD